MDPNLSLADSQALVCRWINEFREARFAYFTWNGIRWDSSLQSVVNIMGAVMLAQLNGGSLPPGFTWRDYNNVDHEVTAQYMMGMAVALGSYYTNTYGASWAHKQAVNALPDIQEVQTYDFSSALWPSQDIG